MFNNEANTSQLPSPVVIILLFGNACVDLQGLLVRSSDIGYLLYWGCYPALIEDRPDH